jgi:hypothetical protein
LLCNQATDEAREGWGDAPSSSWVSVTTPSTWEVPLSTATAFLVALATTSALAAGGASGGGHEAERVERAGRGRGLEQRRLEHLVVVAVLGQLVPSVGAQA